MTHFLASSVLAAITTLALVSAMPTATHPPKMAVQSSCPEVEPTLGSAVGGALDPTPWVAPFLHTVDPPPNRITITVVNKASTHLTTSQALGRQATPLIGNGP